MRCLEIISVLLLYLTLLNGSIIARRHRHAHLHPGSASETQTSDNIIQQNSSWVSARHHYVPRNASVAAALTLIEGPRSEERIDEERNYTRNHAGRHICSHERNVPKMVKTSQAYCKPTYRRFTTRCRDNQTLLCEGVRLVYETAYRDVIKTKITKETSYACCPGWARERKYSIGCLKALCTSACQNGGSCTKPDTCTCQPGFYGKACEHDVNECAEFKPCDQLCYNIPGSYFCTCREAFTLQEDKQSCKKNGGSETALEAKDLEFDSLNARIMKIEQILDNGKSVENMTPYEVNSKIDDALKSIFSLKSRMDVMEEKQKEYDFIRNSFHKYKIHAKKHKLQGRL